MPSDLPPVPASLLPPKPAAVSPARPAQPVLIKTAFDSTPAATAAVRIAATNARQSLASAIRGLVTTTDQVKAALAQIEGDKAAAAIFDHEGLTKADLDAFLKLARPLLDKFTIAPPAAAAS